MSLKASTPEQLLERASKREKARSGRPKKAKGAFVQAVENARDRFVDEAKPDFTKLTGEALLGIYAYLHEKVYGVLPEELADEWYPASATARKFLANNQERFEIPEFMRWVWKRERRSRAGDPEREFRISWRYQFSQRMVTDYRVATKK